MMMIQIGIYGKADLEPEFLYHYLLSINRIASQQISVNIYFCNLHTHSQLVRQPTFLLFSALSMTILIASNHDWDIIDRSGLELALQEARKSYQEGGIPIGSVLLLPDRENPTAFTVLGAGHNERIQKQSPTLHGEISALENAGRQKPETYRNSVLVSSPPFSMSSVRRMMPMRF